jgi:hypothetical protein
MRGGRVFITADGVAFLRTTGTLSGHPAPVVSAD